MGGLVAQRLSVLKAEPFHYFLTSHEIIRRPLRGAKVFDLRMGFRGLMAQMRERNEP